MAILRMWVQKSTSEYENIKVDHLGETMFPKNKKLSEKRAFINKVSKR